MKTVADISPKSKLYQDVKRLELELRTGMVLAVDPSIGSSSSCPGWAVYDTGELKYSGTIDTGGSHLPIWKRARTLADELRAICDDFAPTLLVYEDIPATSGFNANAQASLLKAVGIVLAATNTDECLGVHPASWKNYVRPEYVKGDEADAIEIGYVTIELARTIHTAEHNNSTRRPVSRRGNKGQ